MMEGPGLDEWVLRLPSVSAGILTVGIAAYASRVIQMRDGRIMSDTPTAASGYVRHVTETSA